MNGLQSKKRGDGGEIPGWKTYVKTVLCLKDPEKGNAVDNYRPITCLPLMFPEEQKGCKRKSRGTKDQLY